MSLKAYRSGLRSNQVDSRGKLKSTTILETVPDATKETKGIVKIGDRISVVDGVVSADSQLPSLSGKSGQYLQVNDDATGVEWAEVATGGWDLLWTNSNQGSGSFGTQTVSLDLTSYNFVLLHLQLRGGYSGNVYKNEIVKVGNDCDLTIFGIGVIVRKFCYRHISVTSTGITFDHGYLLQSYGADPTEQADYLCVPLHIYGIK